MTARDSAFAGHSSRGTGREPHGRRPSSRALSACFGELPLECRRRARPAAAVPRTVSRRECCCPHRSSVCPGPSFGSRGTHVMGLGSNPAVVLPPGRFLKRRDHRDRGHFNLHRLSATAQCLSLSRTCLRAHFESGIEPISCHAWSHALILGAFDPFSVRAVRSTCLWLTFQSSVPSDCGRSVICA